MNSNNTLSIFNAQLKQQLSTLQIKPKKSVDSNPWWSIWINFGLGFISELLEIAASFIFGPVTGMLIGIGLDMGFNILADTITNQNPWSANNIIFNIVLPLTTIPGRIKGVSKVRKSKILAIGDATDNNNLKTLSKRLNNIDISDTGAIKNFERKYNQVLMEFEDVNLLQTTKYNQLKEFQLAQKYGSKRIAQFNKQWRRVNNVLSNLANPDQAVIALLKYATKPFKKRWNLAYSKYFKKVKTRFFKIANKSISNELIPLNHTKAPWIAGIRLMPIGHVIGWYHVCIFFDPIITRNKKPVWIYNKSLANIMQFINAPSAGQYYINNICWGWEIGKIIRKNNVKGILSLFNSAARSSYISQFAYQSARTFKSTVKLIDAFGNFKAYAHQWNDAFTTNLPKNAFKAATFGLKGFGAASRVSRMISSGESRHVTRYAQSLTKRGVKYIIKSKHQNILKKIGRA